jgi:hypothetical protein
VVRFFCLLMLLVSLLDAGERQELSGDLSGDLPAGEYVVTSAIVVRRGESLRVPAGTKLYFEQLAGITVFGALSAAGEADDPVVMTSAGGGGGAEAAFHWNGIEADGPEADIALRHVRVSNSVYGVNVKTFGARADLSGVVFENNGYAALMIGGQEVPVAAGDPANVLWDMSPRAPRTLVVKNLNEKPKPESKNRLALRGSALGVAAVGMVLCGANAIKAHGSFKDYINEDDPYKSSVYKEDTKRSITTAGIGAAIATVGLVCVGLTVFF